MTAAVSTDAVEDYSAALSFLGNQLAGAWDIVDWTDGPLAWRYFRSRGASLPDQGWKIHISAGALEAVSMLRAVLEVLAECGASFKVPRRVEDVVYLNSGDAGAAQLGKVVSVYPADDAHAAELIRRLDRVWPASRGPEVTTDLHARPGSAVSFRFGVFGKGPVVTTATGTHYFAVVAPDGARIADVRSTEARSAAHWPNPPVPGVPASVCPVRPGRTIEVDGRRFTALHRMSESPRASVFLGVDTVTLATVVIKVGRPGVGGGLDGRDIADQLGREYRILRALEHDFVSPRPIAWSAGPWPVLVTEDLRGQAPGDLPIAERIACLQGLAAALRRLHDAGIVHGDVKLDNAIVCDGGVRLLDFELAARRGEPIRRGGTRGHMAPEVDSAAAADPTRDVYALAGCVVQAVLDIPPGLLPPGPGRQVALLLQEGHAEAARIVRALTAPDPRDRPDAAAAAEMLAAFASGFDSRPSRMFSPRHRRTRTVEAQRLQRWSRRAAVEAGAHAGTFAAPDGPTVPWRNTHAMRHFDCEAINLGAAGIILGLITIDGALGRRDFDGAVERGARWLADRPPDGQAAGMFTGNAGVALALTVAGRRLGMTALLDAGRRRFEHAAADHRELDLFSGCAGVVWTACMLHDIVECDWPLDLARLALDHLGSRRRTADGVPIWTVDPDADARYLGCAHGSAGIAMALGALGRRTGDRRLTETAIETFRGIAQHGRNEAGDALRVSLDGPGHHALGTWCHGVAGFIWSILQGVGDDPALRDEIDWAVEQVSARPAVGTPTYCHGLAGQLELWRVLAEIPRHRDIAHDRADRAARSLRTMHHTADGRSTWIADDPDITTPDLWVGFLGPASALAMYAGRIGAPLLSGEWLVHCAAPSRHAGAAAPPPVPEPRITAPLVPGSIRSLESPR